MRILLTGARGQLGQHLAQRCPDSVELVQTDRDDGGHSTDGSSDLVSCDLSDRAAVLGLLDEVAPDCIVNPAAWTAVDAAEDHESQALVLNRDLPTWLAEWCQVTGAALISYSTDYVFDGTPGRGWVESDPCRPQSAYGRTKRAGEEALLASGARCLILRTAWLHSALPGNFLTAILNRAAQSQDLKVVADQIGSPTWAGTLAEASWTLLDDLTQFDEPTIMHVAGASAMSWHEFASRAVARAKRQGAVPESVQVDPIESADWPQKARRPAWSVLDCSRFERLTGTRLPDLDETLEECVKQWSQATSS
jgi:dTDP-4-dehydrorhamnose reductase